MGRVSVDDGWLRVLSLRFVVAGESDGYAGDDSSYDIDKKNTDAGHRVYIQRVRRHPLKHQSLNPRHPRYPRHPQNYCHPSNPLHFRNHSHPWNPRHRILP